MKRAILIITVLGLSSWSSTVWAYQASSTNFRIERDSVNIGGELSTSTNYSLEDTVGESGTGTSSSATYKLKAGYQQMDGSTISITAPSDVTLSPNIGPNGGTADGYAEWVVTTDNTSGYTLKIEADTSPAMRTSGGASFANYSSGVSYAWSVASANKQFGFTPEGWDITSAYRDNGAACGVGGTLDTSLACWDNILTSAKLIASTSTKNSSFGGTTTRVRFRAEAGSGSSPTAGSYVATITLTAVTQ